MAWYKKLFGISEQGREVSTAIEIGPGIQLMHGDQLIKHEGQLADSILSAPQPTISVEEILSLQTQLNALSCELLSLKAEKAKEQDSIRNEHIRLLRASAYPSIDSVLEALIEAQEGRSERLQEVIEKRKQVRSLYPKI